ncbi:TonB-dependent receptor [Ginsengibacter hankyongi]|uniref:TonB-dependent receptor n=1 Tax=Ginsengibacter hankyongi TaxID=2607284 RepID=A0A5J5II71_9BACT|nr:TonB-dependent receptor [Ginsengibacter hankyongi]KAA9038427.1 TonB-dependent receptor [Ginsengibacter hankyongi]
MKHLLLLCAWMCSTPLFSQTLKGKVFDSYNHEPLYGASISLGGLSTATDNNGAFSIGCSKSSTLTVSFVGYKTFTHVIKNCDAFLNIALIPVNKNLDEVDITATSNLNKSLLYQPSSITKLGTPELKRGLGLYLDDAINANVPGVTLQRRSVSGGQQFNIRGYGGGSGGTGRISSNFDGQGYKVYLNGIPITDAEGITVLDDIDFGSVGDLEVTKGPSGTLYGLAIAGVVNIKTIKPAIGKVSIGQDVLIGSYGLQRYTTHFEMGTSNSSLLINYGQQETDGYLIHNASHKDFVNLAADFKINEKESVNTYFGYSKSYDQRAGELTLTQYANKDYSGNPDYIIRNGHSEVTSFRAGLSHMYNFNDRISNTTTVYGSGATTNASSAAGWTDKDPINFGLRSTFDTKFSLKKGVSLSGITGIETQHQNAQTIGYGMVKNAADTSGYYIIGAQRSNQYTLTGTTSLFTEWSLTLPHDISFTAGVGLSNMNIQLNDRMYVANSTKPTQYSKNYNGLYSPHFAINKVISKEFSVYGSYSKAYKAPTSSYFYIPSTGAVNTDLKPETGNQFEVGTKGAVLNNKLSYQLALFDAIYSNKFTAMNVLNQAGTATLYTYVVNGGKQDDKGIELLVKCTAYESADDFFQSVRPFANCTYSDFKYVDYVFHTKSKAGLDSAINYDGKKVAGVGPFNANVGLDLSLKYGLYANVTYSYKDAFPITSDGLNITSSYSLLNAKVGFQHSLSNHFDLNVYFGIDNITQTQYPIFVFVNQLPDAYLPAALNANYYGELNLKYNF